MLARALPRASTMSTLTSPLSVCSNPLCTKMCYGNKFQYCARCRIAQYCSVDCQRFAWEKHKLECSEGLSRAGINLKTLVNSITTDKLDFTFLIQLIGKIGVTHSFSFIMTETELKKTLKTSKWSPTIRKEDWDISTKDKYFYDSDDSDDSDYGQKDIDNHAQSRRLFHQLTAERVAMAHF